MRKKAKKYYLILGKKKKKKMNTYLSIQRRFLDVEISEFWGEEMRKYKKTNNLSQQMTDPLLCSLLE